MAENNDCVTWDQQTPPILGNVGCRNPGVGFGGSGWGVGHMKKHIISTGRKARTSAFPTPRASARFALSNTQAAETVEATAFRIAFGEATGQFSGYGGRQSPKYGEVRVWRFKFIVGEPSKV